MDGFYCVPQTLGLVRGEPKEGAKNRADGEPIMREAMRERASRSPTLDRSRSDENEYWAKVGLSELGGDHWEWTKARADEWRSTYTDKNGKERSRRLPRQSVIAIATIVKAPAEVTAGWDKPTRERFFTDATNALKECDPVFYNPANTVYRSVHCDEADGYHVHFAHEARDKDGRYCGSRYDAKWRQGLAATFAKKMREKGWPVLNPKLTDWERYRSVRKARPGERAFRLDRARCGLEAGTRVVWADPAYRQEVDERRRRQGLSVEEHHARMEQAKELEAAKAEQAAAEEARDDAKAVTAQVEENAAAAERARSEAQDKLDGLGNQVTELTTQRDQLKQEVESLEEAKAAAVTVAGRLDTDIARKRGTLKQLKFDIGLEQKRLDDLRPEVDGLKETRDGLKQEVEDLKGDKTRLEGIVAAARQQACELLWPLVRRVVRLAEKLLDTLGQPPTPKDIDDKAWDALVEVSGERERDEQER